MTRLNRILDGNSLYINEVKLARLRHLRTQRNRKIMIVVVGIIFSAALVVAI